MTLPVFEHFTERPAFEPEASPKEPTIDEIVSLLRQLSKLLEIANTQSPKLSDAIAKLADKLSRYKGQGVNQVLDNLTIATRRQPSRQVAKTTIPESLARSITLDEVERLLRTDVSRPDLINIAVLRFGMSRAELMKTKRTAIIDAIRTSISNLRTIDIIGKEASGDRQG